MAGLEAPRLKELFLLDPDVVFLNHGSFGATPRPVFEEYQRWQRELERRPVEFLALERRLAGLLDVPRERLVGHLRVPATDLALATNATSAVNAVARSLPLTAGDEVLTTPDEYPALKLLWEYVSRRTGAAIVERPWDDLEPGPRTRAVFVSHVEWSTGHVNDVASLCARTRAAGALSIIDGAHAPGQLELDLVRLGADVYAGNCHKWLCAPKGSGFLYARPEAQELIDPLVISWDWRQADGSRSPFHQRHRWQGTRDPSALLAISAALDFQAEHDWARVRERCHDLLASFDLGLEPLTDDFVQMRGYRVPTNDPAGLQRRLHDEHRVEVPVIATRDGPVLRVSVQAYNDAGDLDALRTALARTLRR